MKKRLLRFLCAMLAVTASVGTVKASYDQIEDPNSWFFVQLNARISSLDCGTEPGQMKLSFVEARGNDPVLYYPYDVEGDKWDLWITNNPKPLNPYTDPEDSDKADRWSDDQGFGDGYYGAKSGYEEPTYPDYYYINYDPAQGYDYMREYNKEGYDAAFYWYKDGHMLFDANPTAWSTSPSQKGYTKLYAPGIDLGPLSSMASTYVCFNAIVKENPGWYFAGWSYIEGETDIAGTVTTDPEDEQNNIFEVLPSGKSGYANMRTQTVYATFHPVLVADYKVAGMIAGTNASTTVTFDYTGERVDMSDFTLAIADAEDGNDNFEQVGIADFSVAGKVTITVKYKGTAVGEHRGSVTLTSKSGCSSATAPLFARVPSDASIEATLYEDKEPTATHGDLTDMVAAADNTDKIVTLNQNYTTAITIHEKIFLDLNGYQMTGAVTIANGGEVTLVYSKYGGKIDATVTVNNGGKLVLNGAAITSLINNGTVEQNGATITGAATNAGSLTTTEGRFEAGLASSGTLTINGGVFAGATAITISGGTASINKGTINGANYGIESIAGTTNITSKLVSVYGATNAVKQSESGVVNLANGKYDGATPLSGSINLQAGFFKTATTGVALPEGKELLKVSVGQEYNEDYRYFIGTRDVAMNSGVAMCKIGTTGYTTLEGALAYANNNSDKEVVIFMLNDYVLPAGYYTLPKKAKLIVPMNDEQKNDNPIVVRVSNNRANQVDYSKPTEFRRLTFANGVNIEVHGLIELTCTQRASDDAYAAMPHGPYAHLVMEEGSHMTLLDGAELRAWGYMTGKGETDARRGSIVREQFQMGDWKGGSISFRMISDEANLNVAHIFPITQYYIQNIESPVKYHPGAVLSTTTSVSATFGDNGQVGITAAANDIAIVGVKDVHTAMFLMDQEADAENTWVRKWYDAENDIQTYDVNSGAHIGSMVLDIGKLGTWDIVMNSGQFVLPITNNMKIHLLSGEMDFTQSTSLLPGAEVEIDKESTVSITVDANKPDVVSGSLYVYDAAQWNNAVWGKSNNSISLVGSSAIVKYSPSWDGALVSGKPADGQPTARSSAAALQSASVNVHGSFNAKDGFVFTTAGGANIHSSNDDAGSFIFYRNAPADEYVYYFNQLAGNQSVTALPVTSAKLKNTAADSYTETASAGANQIFMYMDGAWKNPNNGTTQTFYFDCYAADADMNVYAAQVMDMSDLTLDPNFPMKEDVKRTVAIYHAPDNIAEYLVGSAIAAQMYGNTPTPQEYEYLKRTDQYKAIFENLKTTQINPQIASIKDAGYDFGSTVQHIYIKPQEWVEIAGTAHVQLAIDDVREFEELYNSGISGNYADCSTAVSNYLDFIESNIMNPSLAGVDGNSDHTYSDAAGAGRLFISVPENDGCQWWEVEKEGNLYHCIHPKNDTYYEWDDLFECWVAKMYTITWKNWDGTIIQTADNGGDLVDTYEVTYGTQAEFLGNNPTREATMDYTYDFTGWNPTPGRVTSNVTYTATYDRKDRMYTIIFKNEGGTEIERQFLKHNDLPVCENVPTRVGYTLQWTPAIAAVVGNATYTATWLEEPPTEYEITFFDYNGETILRQGNVTVGEMPIPPTNPSGKPASSEYTYVFDHWSPAIEKVSATSVKSYTAIYREVPVTYTIIFQNEDGSEIERHEYAYGETPVCSATPSKPNTAEYSYGFAWTPQIQTVQGAATYRATFPATPNQYSLTLRCTPSGAAVITGARADYAYGTEATVTVTPKSGYSFTRWSDNVAIGEAVDDTYSRTVTINENKELTAIFECESCDKSTIRWMNENGEGEPIATASLPVGSATVFFGEKPTKTDPNGQYTYTFYGWSTEPNGNGTKYKNNLTPVVAAAQQTYTYYACFTEELSQYVLTLTSNRPDMGYLLGAGTYQYGTEVTATVTGYDATNYNFDGWFEAENENPTSTDASYTFNIQNNTALIANFSPVTYTITWKSEDGTRTLETDEEQAYGAVTAFNSTVPTKEGYAFIGWTTAANGEGSFYADAATPAVSGNATYYAQYDARSLIVGSEDSQTLTEATDVASFVLTSDGEHSGQLLGSEHLSLLGAAYFDYKVNAVNHQWYAVAVPWHVNAENGISVNGRTLTLGMDFDIIYYDGARRAAEGKQKCWRYVEDDGDKTLVPGRLYMIGLMGDAATIRFAKKAGANLLTTTTSVTEYPQTTGDTQDANWNGVANPALFHAYLNAGTTAGQVYIPAEKRYEPISMSDAKMVVGQGAFVQAPNTINPLTVSYGGAFSAPRRERAEANTLFDVRIAPAGASRTDRLFVTIDEDKEEDVYVIGKDLAKVGVSKKVAQMWVARYNTELCMNTIAPVNGVAEYPLGISVPANGEYTISLAAQPNEEYTVYLTMNGEAIWNLSDGAYTLNLAAGTNKSYGLRLSARKSPSVATGVDEAVVDAQGEIKKVIINNKVFIIRGENVYTIGGQLVK